MPEEAFSTAYSKLGFIMVFGNFPSGRTVARIELPR
jgi:hypothetical protein